MTTLADYDAPFAASAVPRWVHDEPTAVITYFTIRCQGCDALLAALDVGYGHACTDARATLATLRLHRLTETTTDEETTMTNQITIEGAQTEGDETLALDYTLYLIASTPSHGDRHVDPDHTAQDLGRYGTRDESHRAGRTYLRAHPGSWLQVQSAGDSPDDVTLG